MLYTVIITRHVLENEQIEIIIKLFCHMHTLHAPINLCLIVSPSTQIYRIYWNFLYAWATQAGEVRVMAIKRKAEWKEEMKKKPIERQRALTFAIAFTQLNKSSHEKHRKNRVKILNTPKFVNMLMGWLSIWSS